jgi:hypothetical protein
MTDSAMTDSAMTDSAMTDSAMNDSAMNDSAMTDSASYNTCKECGSTVQGLLAAYASSRINLLALGSSFELSLAAGSNPCILYSCPS